jgi:hypothetical protein
MKKSTNDRKSRVLAASVFAAFAPASSDKYRLNHATRLPRLSVATSSAAVGVGTSAEVVIAEAYHVSL